MDEFRLGDDPALFRKDQSEFFEFGVVAIGIGQLDHVGVNHVTLAVDDLDELPCHQCTVFLRRL